MLHHILCNRRLYLNDCGFAASEHNLVLASEDFTDYPCSILISGFWVFGSGLDQFGLERGQEGILDNGRPNHVILGTDCLKMQRNEEYKLDLCNLGYLQCFLISLISASVSICLGVYGVTELRNLLLHAFSKAESVGTVGVFHLWRILAPASPSAHLIV